MKKKFTRREFLNKSSIGIGMLSIEGLDVFNSNNFKIPKRKLGRTGATVSCLGFGGGTFWRDIIDESTAEKFLHYAVKLGINYFDGAKLYGSGKTEKRYGRYLTPKYRNRIFLVSKTTSRSYDRVMKDIEISLKRMNTDYLDLFLMHGIDKMSDIEALSGKSGGYKAYKKLKDEGIVKNIGYSYHKWNKASHESFKRFDPDVVMCVLNAAENSGSEKNFLRLASERNVGIVAMKVMGAGALVGNVPGEDLLRYTLSLPISVAAVGMANFRILESCVKTAKTPTISEKEAEQIHKKLNYNRKTHKLPYVH